MAQSEKDSHSKTEVGKKYTMKTHVRRQQHKKLKHQDIKQKEPPQLSPWNDQYRFKTASNFVLLIVPSRHLCGGSFRFMSWCLIFLCCWCLMYVFIFLVTLKVTDWPPIGKIAAHSAYEMFSW